MKLRFIPIFLISLILLLAITAGCTGEPEEQTVLRIVPAGSLLVPFESLEADFEASHPGVDVQVEGHGSIQCIRQVTDLHRDFDLVVVADASLIPDMMYIPVEDGEGNYADNYTPLARNAMVLAYTNQSMYADEISSENWYEILSRPDVKVGFSNPVLDAAGYRAFMVPLLAGEFYAEPHLFDEMMGNYLSPAPNVTQEGGNWTVTLAEHFRADSDKLIVRDGSIYLLYLLDAGGVDYAYEYRSVAQDHGLLWVDLPEELDMSNASLSEEYGRVTVNLGFQRFASIGSERRGQPIVYAATVPATAEHPELAAEFVEFMAEEFSKGRPNWPPVL